MPTNIHQFNASYIPSEYGNVGDPPSSAMIAEPARKIYQHLRTWRYRGSFWCDSHPPDPDVCFGASAETPYVDYYVILYGPPRVDGAARQLAAAGLLWATGDGLEAVTTRTTRTAQWHQPANTGAWRNEEDISVKSSVANGYAEPCYGDQTSARMWSEKYFQTFFDWDSRAISTSNGFSYGRFRTNNMFASLTFWENPDITLTEEYMRLHPRYFVPGETIRGYAVDGTTTRTEVARPSVGHLIHHVGDGWEDRDFVENATRRCMFQWGHSGGIYCTSTDTEYLFGASSAAPWYPFVKPRDLRSLGTGNTIECLPALVVTDLNSATSARIRMTTLTTGSWWQYELQGGETQALIVPDSTGTSTSPNNGETGLLVDRAGELIKIEVEVANPGDELLVHTVSLWDGPDWSAGYWPQTDPATGTGA